MDFFIDIQYGLRQFVQSPAKFLISQEVLLWMPLAYRLHYFAQELML